MSKHALRRQLIKQRRQLQPQTAFAFGQRVQRALLQEPAFKKASSILLYSPIQNEVGTDLILSAALRHGLDVVYPRVRGADLDLVQVERASDLQPGAYGISEPSGTALYPLEALDVMIVPGVAFDRQGYRLGFGKGFYDRLLSDEKCTAVLIGLCYSFQLVGELPTEPHDVPVDSVMTEKERLVTVPA